MLAAAAAPTHRALTLGLFAVVVLISLGITTWAARYRKTRDEFFTAGRGITGRQNGLAMAGDSLSASAVLGAVGLVSLFGYDGFMFGIANVVAFAFLLLLAGFLRNSGRFTVADVLSFRVRQRPVRIAGACSSLSISIFYLVAQMVGAGALLSLLIGTRSAMVQNAAITAVGVLMIVYVVFGGMRGATWVQIIKAVVLMGIVAVLAVLVLARFGFDPGALLAAANEGSGRGEAFLAPGLQYKNPVDLISLGIGVSLAFIGLPHIFQRFYTVRDDRAAESSAVWLLGIEAVFTVLVVLILGLGAVALVGAAAITASDPGGNTAALLLAQELGGGAGSIGGDVFVGVFAAVAFATILAVVAGLMMAATTTFAHDLYANVLKRGRVTDGEEVKVARIAAVVMGLGAIGLSLYAQRLNIGFIVGLAMAIAASAHVPSLVLNLFWRRFNTRGALWGIYGGLATALVLVIFSPTVSGSPRALFTSVDFHWFPLQNPGLVSVPAGFLFAWLGAISRREPAAEDRFPELEIRAITGDGSH
ncbi:MAG: cation acetate symporter [Pseudonocardia sp.]|nr:cation acetate symporter [Pseudonocardia sp.]